MEVREDLEFSVRAKRVFWWQGHDAGDRQCAVKIYVRSVYLRGVRVAPSPPPSHPEERFKVEL